MNNVLDWGGNPGELEEQAGRYKQKSLPVISLRNAEAKEAV